jgi:hypothetical protein
MWENSTKQGSAWIIWLILSLFSQPSQVSTLCFAGSQLAFSATSVQFSGISSVSRGVIVHVLYSTLKLRKAESTAAQLLQLTGFFLSLTERGLVPEGSLHLSYYSKTLRRHIVRPSLQRYFTENSKHIFPEKELRGHSPKSYIHVSVCDLYISTIYTIYIFLSASSAEENRWTHRGNI